MKNFTFYRANVISKYLGTFTENFVNLEWALDYTLRLMENKDFYITIDKVTYTPSFSLIDETIETVFVPTSIN